MPIYPPAKISNAELVQITTYIDSLNFEHGHVSIENPKLASFQHHWMALLALENESTEVRSIMLITSSMGWKATTGLR